MNYKKVVSLGIVLSMVLGSNVSALPVGTDALGNSGKPSQKELLEQFRSGMAEQIKVDKELSQIKDSDTVRVIVEMSKDSVIAKATEKGVKIDEMGKTEVEDLQQEALASQKKVQTEMDKKDINFELIEQFTNVLNGFSVKTTLAEAKEIEKLEGVKSVSIANEYERPEPDMTGSNDITEAAKAWANGYDGEGTVVAILDTGIDSGHKDMVLSKDTKAKLDENGVNKIIDEDKLPGEFKTDKVPYGYNYMDGNDEIRDIGPEASEHGMHVAGIVGANGDTENGGIKGTAPECQLLAMKVFGNNPEFGSTYSDILIKAMDDSIELGADVLNMSLGATAGFVDDDDPEQRAVNNVAANGIVVTVSAGNSYYYGYGYDYPYASNPDYGVIGSPSSSREAFTVASTENKKLAGYALEYNNAENVVKALYSAGGSAVLQDIFKGQKLQVVDCGYGNLSEMPDSLEGKAALIQRGDITFVEKINNAEVRGASLAIIYNHKSGGNVTISMAVDGTNIPSCSIGYEDGLNLLEAMKNNPDLTIAFNGNMTTAIDPLYGQMSDFSSIGVTPDLGLKPDITGVGGNVWSTANNDGYQNMSGTSMAAPNIAGCSSVVYNMMAKNDNFKSLTGLDKVNMAKNLLMCTAVPNVDSYSKLYVSPRSQGAGVANVAAATSTPAVVTDAAAGVSKVNLKEIKGNKAEFTVKVQNYSDKDIVYNLSGTVQSDLNELYYGTNYTDMVPQAILNGDKMPITFSKDQIKVPANGSKEVTVTVDLSYAELENGMTLNEAFVNGAYVEGFVVFDDPEDINPQLSIPYMGFYGDWNKAPIIDYSKYDEEQSFYDETVGSWYDSYGDIYYLGKKSDESFDGNYLDISPNNDDYNDNFLAVLSYLRNIKNMEIEILDADGNVVKNLCSKENIRKHYYWDGKGPMYEILEDAAWDGTIDGKVAEEGTYTYRIKSRINYEGADYQYKDFKINVDLTAPTIENMNFDEKTHKFTVVAEDNFKGHINYYRLLTPNGPIDSYDGTFDLTDLYEDGYTLEDCSLGVVDYAMNVAVAEMGEPQGPADGDTTPPVVKVLDPEFLDILGYNEVSFTGIVTDESSLAELTVDGNPVNYSWSPYIGGWGFTYTTTLEDGYQSVYINAKDSAGNELGFSHKVFIDTKAPVVELEDIPEVTTKDTVNIKGLVTENTPSVKVTLNGTQLCNIDPDWEAYDYYEPASYAIDYDYKLSDGENTITVEAEDLIGHTASRTLTITKAASLDVNKDNKIIGKDRYATAVEISKKGWEKSNYAVLANGTGYTDALVSAPLAAAYEAPILLTERDQLTDVTAEELQRLGVKNVFIAGGTGVVSNDVVNTLTKAGISSIRLGGSDRYETSVIIAKYIDRQNDIKDVYVTGGLAIPDAVTISSKAAMDKTPIILVENQQIPEKVSAWLSEQNLEKAVVVGGPGVVADDVLTELDAITSSEEPTERIFGANRYDTNAAVINALFPEVVESVMVTGSDVFVDALVAAPYAAQKGAPIVIATEKLSDSQSKVLDKMLSYEVVQVGGRVNDSVIEDVAARLSVQK